MARYEYKVVPAPRAAAREKGVKGTDARFAHTLTALMNDLGADGWEYLRAETLPCEERKGLTGRTEITQHILIFRREKEAPAEAADPRRPDPVIRRPSQPAEPERLILQAPRRD